MGVLGAWLAVTAVCLSFSPAHADAVFDATGTFTDNSMFSGTITINTTTGMIDGADLSYLGNTYTTVSGAVPFPNYDHITALFDVFDPSGDVLALLIGSPGGSLIGYAGGNLCSVSALCGPDTQNINWVGSFQPAPGGAIFLQTGELTAATPLPAALPLFATGLGALGLLGWRRKWKATRRVAQKRKRPVSGAVKLLGQSQAH